MNAWALVDKNGKLVRWKSLADGEEGFEIHRTRKLARDSKMAGERVVKINITQLER